MNLCDDHYAYNLDKLNFAVSDGASCNLASRIYSRLLVDNFAEYGEEMFLESVRNRMCDMWRSETDQMINLLGNPYYLRNMFASRKEAAATFVGMSICKDDNQELLWNCYVLGDSVLIHVPEGDSLPDALYTTNKEELTSEFSSNIVFDNNPQTAHPYNSQLWRNQVWEVKGQKLNEGTFILMTDALAEWFILPNHKSTEEKLSMLMQLDSDEDFTTLIDSERSVRLSDNTSPLHDDDVTLMIIHIDNLSTLLERNSIVEKVKSNYRCIIESFSKQEVFDRMKGEVVKVEEKLKLKDEEDSRILQEKKDSDEKLISYEKRFQEQAEELRKKVKELDEKSKIIYNLSQSNDQLKEQIATLEGGKQNPPITNIDDTKDELTKLWESTEGVKSKVNDIDKRTQGIQVTLEDDEKERLANKKVEEARYWSSQETMDEMKVGIQNIEKKNDSFLDKIQQIRFSIFLLGGISFIVIILLIISILSK